MRTQTINTADYYTTAEAAKMIGKVDTETVRRYCGNHIEGKTPAIAGVLIGRSWMIHKNEIARFKRERREPGRPRQN